MAARDIERFNPADPAEHMLSRMRAECVGSQRVLALDKLQVCLGDKDMLIGAHGADRAITLRYAHSLWRGKFKLHRLAMTAASMFHEPISYRAMIALARR